MCPSPIKYQQLDPTKNEIRLLTILPPKGPFVRCKLEQFSLDIFSSEYCRPEFEKQVDVVKWIEAEKTRTTKLGRLRSMTAQTSRNPGLGYMALSYTWGDQSSRQNLIVNEETVDVAENLELALRALQEDPNTLQGLRLWADMLCINQGDTKEREDQVARMQDIYKRARRVLAWLGPKENQSDDAIRFLYSIYTELDGKQESSRTAAMRLVRSFGRTGWEVTEQFFCRQYFCRLWILQELAAGSNNALVICGKCRVPWAVVSYGAEILWKNFHSIIAEFTVNERRGKCDIFWTALRRIHRLNKLIRQEESNSFDNVYQIFDLGVTSQASENCDRIYGLKGLMRREISLGIRPNYTKSFHDVCLEFAMAFIRATQCLDIIYLGSLERANSELPSWIPDWSKRQKMTILSFSRAMSFKTCGSVLPINSHLKADRYLQCKGVLFDIINKNGCDQTVAKNNSHVAAHITPASIISQSHHANVDFLKGYLQRSMAMVDSTYGDWYSNVLGLQMTAFDIPWCDDETLKPATWDLWINHGWSDCRYRYRPAFRNFHKFRLQHAQFNVYGYRFKDFFPETITECGDPKKIGQMLKTLALALPHRTLVGTCCGFLGLATENVQDGDLIFILFGCRFPVVLRPQGEYYKVIGEIYVYGIMNGETMRVFEEGKCDLQEIVLC